RVEVLEDIPGESKRAQPSGAVLAAGLEAGRAWRDDRIGLRLLSRARPGQSALLVCVERNRDQAGDPSAQVRGVWLARVGERYVRQLFPEQRLGHSKIEPLAGIHG